MTTHSTLGSASAEADVAGQGQEQFRALLLNLPAAVYRREYSRPWALRFVSDYVEVLTGYAASDFTTERVRSLDSIICLEDRGRVAEAVESALRRDAAFAVEYRLLEASGSYRWVADHGRSVPGPDGLPLWIDGVLFDLSAHKAADNGGAEARRHLGHDPLTSLPDKTLIRDRLQQLLLRSQRGHELVAVLLVDLDHFSSVNEWLGPRAGDELLKAAADRMTGVLRACDTIGRPRGDEFLILADGLSLSGGPELLAERLLDSLREPFVLDGFEDDPLSVTASIGIATNEADEPDDLLRDAAVALCQAKARGRNCQVRYEHAMKTAAMERLELETDLRDALQENQFLLAYQPVFELDSSGVWGVEAFLRWRHPVRGVVDPEYFLPVLEDTEMIVPVGHWVLQQVCRQAVAWRRLGYDLAVVVNVSEHQLEAEDFAKSVSETLEAAGLEPSSLILDVGQKALSRAGCRLRASLRELEGLGVTVAADGSATGASPDGLREMGVRALKVGTGGIAAISDHPEAIEELHNLLERCRVLGIETFAVGVEHGWQLATLQKEGCRFGQGSYFSHPIPAEALQAILSLEPLFG